MTSFGCDINARTTTFYGNFMVLDRNVTPFDPMLVIEQRHYSVTRGLK